MNTSPTLRLLSLGAGVQSTTLALLAADGTLPGLDGAVFADTGWEPASVYRTLDRLSEHLAGAGIPVHRVSVGNIRADALDPAHRFASMPMYVRNQDGGDGMTRRQCTSEYKLRPVREQTRRLLGATDKPNGRPGRVPTGRFAETWVGITTDEADRADPKMPAPKYAPTRYPLLEMGWSRADCQRFLRRVGWGETAKSSCIGCPFHTNATWREMRDNRPDDFADAVAFDASIRTGNARATAEGKELRGQMFLHRSRLPLSVAPIDRVTAREWAERQGDLVELSLQMAEENDPGAQLVGCSPYGCAK